MRQGALAGTGGAPREGAAGENRERTRPHRPVRRLRWPGLRKRVDQGDTGIAGTWRVPDLVASALRAHRIRQFEERLAAGARWQDSGLVFTTGIGTPIGTHSLHSTFKAMLQRAGLPNIRCQGYRPDSCRNTR